MGAYADGRPSAAPMHPFRLITHALEIVLALPVRAIRAFLATVVFNPKLGALRHVVIAIVGYVAFAVVLVYVVAPLRGVIGSQYLSAKLRYDAERWLAPAIYDSTGAFVGTFDAPDDRDRRLRGDARS
jgi:penicillin-binding protein 1A